MLSNGKSYWWVTHARCRWDEMYLYRPELLVHLNEDGLDHGCKSFTTACDTCTNFMHNVFEKVLWWVEKHVVQKQI